MKKNGRLLFLITVSIILLSTLLATYIRRTYDLSSLVQVLGDPLVLSNKNIGYYESDLEIKLHRRFGIPWWLSIHYTLDGQDPTSTSPTYHFLDTLTLSAPASFIKVYPLKVSVCNYRGQCSPPNVYTYVLGKNIRTDVSIDIISLTVNNEDLYSVEQGLLVDDKIYDDEGKIISEPEIWNVHRRDRDWAKAAYVTSFDKNGQAHWHQAVDVMVSGDSSALENPKSLKLYAVGDEKLTIDFYEPGQLTSYQQVNKYNSLRLHAGAQDRGSTYLRSALVSELTTANNYDGASASRRAALFLNGEYYAVVDIQQNFSPSFLRRKYDLPNTTEIEKVKGGEYDVLHALGVMDYFQTDLNNAHNREILEQFVDMDSYLRYYAINIVMNNIDWGHKNYEAWRWRGESNPYNQYTDGRVRFLLYDVDFVYRLQEMTMFGVASGDTTLQNLLVDIPVFRVSSFGQVMASQYYREKFLALVNDLMAHEFASSSVIAAIDHQQQIIDHWLKQTLSEVDYEQYHWQVDTMRQIALDQPAKLAQSIDRLMHIKPHYFTLNLHTHSGVSVSWLGREVAPDSTYSGQFYDEAAWDITAQTGAGWQFSHFLINGQIARQPHITINRDLIENGSIDLEVFVQPVDRGLTISALAAAGSQDWFTLTNLGNEAVSLDEYYVSDTPDNLSRCPLPSQILPSGASVTIYGQNAIALPGEYTCNFSLSDGEVLTLSHAGEVIERVYIHRHSDQSFLTRIGTSPRWWHISTQSL